MAADIPTSEPLELVAGDTWKWRREDLGDWPASSWTLVYYFNGAGGAFSITATADGVNFAVSVAAATTAARVAGEYSWEAYVSGGTSERYRVARGALTVRPNLATATAADRRSFAVKALEAIEAALISKASKDQLSLQIAGRSIQRYSFEELAKMRKTWRAEVKAEIDAERRRRGLAVSNSVYVSFRRPS